jgi:bifunctional non-homologous end joining protein LigD
MSTDEVRDGVELTNLDQQLFEGAGATKREFVDYLDAVAEQMIPAMADRPLSVIRILRGQDAFMQKNLPKYTPPWVPRVQLWAESAKRDVTYALCNDRRTLLWFANQRAVEYHVALSRIGEPDRPTQLVLDIDPPESGFRLAVEAAWLVREALAHVGMTGAVKTSGAKGVHIFVPITGATTEEVAAATRALAARAELLDPALATTAFVIADRGGKVFLDSTRADGATVVSVYSPRRRAGLPVSFPVSWDQLGDVSPGDFTVRTALGLMGGSDPWSVALRVPQVLSPDLIAEGRQIPIARVQAMHEGKRRAREARTPPSS